MSDQTPDLARLETLAQQATPGPWAVDARAAMRVVGPHERSVATTGWHSGGYYENIGNAAYIAACSPDTILALIAWAREQQVQLEAVRFICDPGHQANALSVPALVEQVARFAREQQARAEQGEAHLSACRELFGPLPCDPETDEDWTDLGWTRNQLILLNECVNGLEAERDALAQQLVEAHEVAKAMQMALETARAYITGAR